MLQLVLGETNFSLQPGQAELVLFDFVKLLFVLGAILYLIFAFVVVRQIQVMRSTLITPASAVIQLLGLLHLLGAFGVLLFFIVTL